LNVDFLSLPGGLFEGEMVFVGNPPYVRQKSANSPYPNLYADFLERMLSAGGRGVSISLIVPLSISFSRDYAALRSLLRRRNVNARIENFDNIPDSLFKFGKPGALNSNQANSQRCSIIHLSADADGAIEATGLQRWTARERTTLLRREPDYIDVSRYSFDDRFPRPDDKAIVRYLNNAKACVRLSEITTRAGPHRLGVASVARNFIGIREAKDGNTCIELSFADRAAWATALQIISSPLFLGYWRTVGDGFHVTKGLVDRFPIAPAVLAACRRKSDHAESVWSRRDDYRKSKANSGRLVQAYDFSGAFDYLALPTVATLTGQKSDRLSKPSVQAVSGA